MFEWATGVAGPPAGMVPADHGAEALKAEAPGGDPWAGGAESDALLGARCRTAMRQFSSGWARWTTCAPTW